MSKDYPAKSRTQDRDPRRDGAAEPLLIVEHCTTADMADGQALPPVIEDGAVWRVVRRAEGRTIWRRISLSPFSRHRLARGVGD